MKFSIIIPLYNKAPYVRKAFESVLAQTFTDFELIVVDDGSNDNSAVICNEYISTIKHSVTINQSIIENIRIISQTNAGVAAARNNGVKASHGEFLCFLDADDWWEPTFLEEVAKLIAEYPDAGIYATNYIYYKLGKTHVALNLPRGYMNYPDAYLHGPMPIWTGATCMPRKVFDEMGGFPVGIKLGEDFLLWAKTALHYKVAFCEKPLAYYNNDVPASLRATRNLHAPEHHMLFNMQEIEQMINDHTASADRKKWPMANDQSAAWRALLDKLRVNGLLDYWLDERYLDIAAAELAKVDWSKQPHSAKAQYEKPIWLLKAMRRFVKIGSFFKQKMIRLFVYKQRTVV